MSQADDATAARITAETEAHVARWREERAAVPPTVVTSEDEEVEIEMTADLEVTRVTLRATATRDRQRLEDSLVEVIGKAITTAQQSSRSADSLFAELAGPKQEEFRSTLDDLSSQVEQRTAEARAQLDALQARIRGSRPSAQWRSPSS